jgi:tetratricopeptide (TPR) repeat protein
MTERERYRTLGLYHSIISNNYEKSIENYQLLLKKYPADAAGLNNLSMNYFVNRRFKDAQRVQKELLNIYPANILYLSNYALISMYANDQVIAVDYAKRVLDIDKDHFVSYIPLVMTALSERGYRRAANYYARMSATGSAGTLHAMMGKADILMARGDYSTSIEVLHEGLDQAALSLDLVNSLTQKIWLAEAYYKSDQSTLALAMLEEVQQSNLQSTQQIAVGELYVLLDKLDRAEYLAINLAASLNKDSRAYGALLKARIELAQNNPTAALDTVNQSLALVDLWAGHYFRAHVYLQSKDYVAAMDEFDLCMQRYGEGFAIFLDDIATFRKVSEIPYWLGRSQEAIGSFEAAIRRYKDFLETRDLGATQSLVLDAQSRIERLMTDST